MLSTKYILTLAILVALASSAFAVRCYQCTTLGNPKCGEHFDSDDIMEVDCNQMKAPFFLLSLMTGRNHNATGCMKQTVESTAGGGVHVLRSCYFGDISHTETGCKVDPTHFGVRQSSCDVCSDNLCNGSSSMAPIAVAVVLLFGIARIFS